MLEISIFLKFGRDYNKNLKQVLTLLFEIVLQVFQISLVFFLLFVQKQNKFSFLYFFFFISYFSKTGMSETHIFFNFFCTNTHVSVIQKKLKKHLKTSYVSINVSN